MELHTHRVAGIAFLVVALLMVLALPAHAAPSTAKQVFDRFAALVYQIRVIDIGSGDKYSIGSGFRVSDSGHIATNYHVISSYINEPEKYRLEYVAADESIAPLAVYGIDIVHDLAIVYTEEAAGEHFAIDATPLPKGERIFSMGNPHDLGMTIVEGNYNGLIEKSRYRKILFSGSLNGGMSGGPALNTQGEVIGVNVSKLGDQISFLVPATHLVALLQHATTALDVSEFNPVITADLLADQDVFYQRLVTAELNLKTLGDSEVPSDLHPSLNCWGHSVDEDEKKYQAAHQHCKSEDRIYIKQGLTLGQFNYDVEFIETDELNRFQFYNFLEHRFDHTSFYGNFDKDEEMAFSCHDDDVTLASGDWKVSSCFRPYKKFEGLYDASMMMIATEFGDKTVLVKVSGAGITKDNAIALFQKVMGAVQWNH